MEITNNQIQNELFPLSDKSNEVSQCLMREKGYIKESLDKVQYHFSDQEVGRLLINTLMQSMREIQCAYSELEQLKGSIIEFTRVLTK
jgi:hypothetical protein